MAEKVTDLEEALKDLEDFKDKMENIFISISPAHRVEKLPPLMNHIGHVLVIVGKTLQEEKTQKLTLTWLDAYNKELIAMVDFAYGYIDVMKLMTRKIFKMGKTINTKTTVNQRLIDNKLGSILKKCGIRIMSHIYDIQSLFKR